MATVLAPQRMEVMRPVVVDNHELVVDQERLRLGARGMPSCVGP